MPEAEVTVNLALREVMNRPRAGSAESRRVDPGEVVERQDDAALHRNALRAVDPERRDELRERLDRPPANRPDGVNSVHAGSRCRTSFSIRSTTSPTSSSLVSITSASS